MASLIYFGLQKQLDAREELFNSEELAGVKGERDARVQEISEATEEAELTLLQLHKCRKN